MFSQLITNPAIATIGGLSVLTLMAASPRAGEWLNSIGTTITPAAPQGDKPAQPALLAFEPPAELPAAEAAAEVIEQVRIPAAELIARESAGTRMYPGKPIPFKAAS